MSDQKHIFMSHYMSNYMSITTNKNHPPAYYSYRLRVERVGDAVHWSCRSATGSSNNKRKSKLYKNRQRIQTLSYFEELLKIAQDQ